MKRFKVQAAIDKGIIFPRLVWTNIDTQPVGGFRNEDAANEVYDAYREQMIAGCGWCPAVRILIVQNGFETEGRTDPSA